MKPRLALLALCLALAGCGLIVQPKDAQPAPVVKQTVSTADFFASFAQYVEDGGFDKTQRLAVCCSKAMHKAGVQAPATYDTMMEKYAAKNVRIDDELRKKIVADIRSLK